MIFDVGGQVLHAGIERRPLGDGPGFQYAIDFQAEVIVQARGVVALHAKDGAGAGCAAAHIAWRRRRFGSA